MKPSPPGLKAAQSYWPLVQAIAADVGVPAVTLLAIMWRESYFGLNLTPPGPGGTGDFGHGRGLMQIDDRAHAEWIREHDWGDPAENIRKGAQVLKEAHDFFRAKGLVDGKLWQATLAAYNAGAGRVLAAVRVGRDPDEVTTGRDYGAWVTARAVDLSALGFS